MQMMKLSELKTGECGTITKVLGHGGFRKRIMEMGFVKGKAVEVLLNAPLQDPVKSKVMGYEVSLRRQEAELIEVVPSPTQPDEARMMTGQNISSEEEATDDTHMALRSDSTERAEDVKEAITVALIGNPNC